MKTQLFRRKITTQQAEAIFINPRVHTGLGYYHKTDTLESLTERSITTKKRERELVYTKQEEGQSILIESDEEEEEEFLRPSKRSFPFFSPHFVYCATLHSSSYITSSYMAIYGLSYAHEIGILCSLILRFLLMYVCHVMLYQ